MDNERDFYYFVHLYDKMGEIVAVIVDRISNNLLFPEELITIKCNIHFEC